MCDKTDGSTLKIARARKLKWICRSIPQVLWRIKSHSESKDGVEILSFCRIKYDLEPLFTIIRHIRANSGTVFDKRMRCARLLVICTHG